MYPFVVIRVNDVFTRPTAWFFYPISQRAPSFLFDAAKVGHKKTLQKLWNVLGTFWERFGNDLGMAMSRRAHFF